MNYIVINRSVDGFYTSYLTKEKLKERLSSYQWGDKVKFLSELPDGAPDEWLIDDGQVQLIIIKGEIIVPLPEQVVTSYKLD